MNLRTCLNTVHVVICLSISTKVTPLTLSTGASLLHMLIRYTSCLSCGEEEVMVSTGAPILYPHKVLHGCIRYVPIALRETEEITEKYH